MIRVGLRFDRRDAKALAELADRVRRGEFGPDAYVSLFVNASRSARIGEPLIVDCEHTGEAVLLADGFIPYGITRPAVERLVGQRKL